MVPCTSCGTHHRAHGACPHCGVRPAPHTGKVVAAAVLALGLAACGDGTDDPPDVQALYGVVVSDEDGDGYDAGVDCDDANPDVHPDAAETPGDGVDSNCDGSDDT